MPAVRDPETGLEFYELSHTWGMYTPIFPGYEEIKLANVAAYRAELAARLEELDEQRPLAVAG